MRAPKWLRAIARRKTGAEADAESAAGLIAWAPAGERMLNEEEYERLRASFLEAMKRDRSPVLLSAGEGVPAFSPRHRYGGAGTIHKTGTIDIQVDKITGEVHAVWFRCLNLPFHVSEVRDDQVINPVRDIAIEEITYAELPREDNSQ